MIISASRRTDVPAFYSEWFMNRIKAGFCEVPNPFNPSQVSRVSLCPEDVDAIAFWTRNAAPLLPHLEELDAHGYHFFFLYTLLDYPELLEPHAQPFQARVRIFRQLANRIGPERVVWRYDPIVISTLTPVGFHKATFSRIATQLKNHTGQCIVSFVDLYRKLNKQLRWLEERGCTVREPCEEEIKDLASFLSACAHDHGIRISSCAEKHDMTQWGILAGKCIDGDYINATFGLALPAGKDPAQRPACGCAISKDIGCYDTCLHGCRYCYATSSEAKARNRFTRHDPQKESMVSAD